METVVLIPCYNEEQTIAKVAQDFKEALPRARIVVFDNNSTDNSAQMAARAGIEVISITRKGKGYLVGRMFELIDADIYVMVDGDDTYFAKDAAKLIEPVVAGRADMAVGSRVPVSKKAMKVINRFGNMFFSRIMGMFFRVPLCDTLSGYRVFNREFVKNVPVMSFEFEVEAELTLQALSRGMRIEEIPVDYKERPDGSVSKLKVFKDGYMVLSTVIALFRDLRPLTFFSWLAVVIWLGCAVYGMYVYYALRVANIFDAIILTSFFIIGWLMLFLGFSLHVINRRFAESLSLYRKSVK